MTTLILLTATFNLSPHVCKSPVIPSSMSPCPLLKNQCSLPLQVDHFQCLHAHCWRINVHCPSKSTIIKLLVYISTCSSMFRISSLCGPRKVSLLAWWYTMSFKSTAITSNQHCQCHCGYVKVDNFFHQTYNCGDRLKLDGRLFFSYSMTDNLC